MAGDTRRFTGICSSGRRVTSTNWSPLQDGGEKVKKGEGEPVQPLVQERLQREQTPGLPPPRPYNLEQLDRWFAQTEGELGDLADEMRRSIRAKRERDAREAVEQPSTTSPDNPGTARTPRTMRPSGHGTGLVTNGQNRTGGGTT